MKSTECIQRAIVVQERQIVHQSMTALLPAHEEPWMGTLRRVTLRRVTKQALEQHSTLASAVLPDKEIRQARPLVATPAGK
mmetsp:Transcript_86647/g.172948  ORF Transcript_86647/g.172948 Transcript_86647/m.172948 type:complete len:81 (+) Transcript_86647:83-325(+)